MKEVDLPSEVSFLEKKSDKLIADCLCDFYALKITLSAYKSVECKIGFFSGMTGFMPIKRF